MVLSVGTNTGALMAQAAASSVNKSMESSMERLATGKRINSASDDAAGVAIASRLTSEIKGTNQAIRNAMDGQALLDTAEGAHIEIENILQRMREISVQSRNDTNNSADRANLQLEMDALTNEIDRIANSTSWAGQKLLTGSGGNNSNGTFALQVGSKTNAEDTITTTVKAMTAAGLGVGAGNASVGVNGATLTAQGAQVLEINGTATKGDVYNFTLNGDAVSFELTADDGTDFTVANVKINNVAVGAAASANKVDLADMTLTSLGNDNHAVAKAAAVIVGAMADTTDGGSQGGMTATAASDATVTFNQTVALTAANYDNAAAASGTDDIAGVMNAAGDKITFTNLKTATHASADDFAFTINGVDMAFADMKTNFAASEEGFLAAIKETIADHAGELKGLTLTAAYASNNLEISIAKATALTAVSATAGSSSTALDIKTSAAAKTSITAIDAAIITLNNQRASLGSVSNRLDSTVSNLTNISSNLSAGRGRIEDADFAAETTNLAKTQILQQASTAMLAQANASKQGVLSLLQG
jgi:flagellin